MTEEEAKYLIVEYKPVIGFVKYREALNVAIKALEKQIPKKVHEEAWIYTKCDCGYEFSRHHGDGYYTVPYHKKTNYCPKCGQKLDWSEV